MADINLDQLIVLARTNALMFLLGLLVSWIIARLVYELVLSPYRNIPGPFLAKFTRLWEVYHLATGLTDAVLLELHVKYGPVVRVGPSKLSFDEPSDCRVIYNRQTHFPKSDFYMALEDPKRPSLFSTRDEADHAERKRKIAGLYSMSTLLAYEPAVNKMIETGKTKLQEFSETGEFVSVDRFFHYFAFDLILRITYNRDINLLERFDDLNGIIAGIEKVAFLGPILGGLPEIIPWFGRIGKARKKASPGVQMAQSNRHLVGEVRKDHIEATANSKAEPFAYKCFALEAAGKLTPQGTLDSGGSDINAGSDTTGSTLAALTWYLWRDPELLAKVREEFDGAADQGLISSPVTFQEVQTHLPYAQAVIKEALRLRPAVASILPRIVPAPGVELAGRFFPAGAEVGVHARVMHLNERYHGPDCKIWRPECWLEVDEARDDEKTVGNFFSFGAGTRVCLGKNISLLEMHKLVPELVRHFDFEFEKDDQGNIREPVRGTGFFASLRFRCRVTRRSR